MYAEPAGLVRARTQQFQANVSGTPTVRAWKSMAQPAATLRQDDHARRIVTTAPGADSDSAW